MKSIKIFVSAYACEPDRGSEPGVGWHWVLEMSKYYELWVLTRANNREKIEGWISKNNEVFGNIHFIYFDLPLWIKSIKKSAVGLWIYYFLWQWYSNKVVKKTMNDHQIKVFHHITFGNAIFPISRYGQKQYFIWGPVGGAATLPLDFIQDFPFWSRVKEYLQYLLRYSVKLNIGFIYRCKSAKLILCKTDEIIQTIPKRYREKCVQFTDVAIDIDPNASPPILKEEGIITFIAVGTLEAWRNFDIMIKAFVNAHKIQNNIQLKIIGDGSDRSRLENLTERLNAKDYIIFKGGMCMAEYKREMESADAVINPSYREGSVTVSFDAVKFGKPLVCFETGGFTHHFNDDFCFILKNANNKGLAIRKLSEAIKEVSDWKIIQNMGENAFNAQVNMSWGNKGRDIHILFDTYFTKDGLFLL